MTAKKAPFDIVLTLCALALSAIGIAFIYSASSYSADLQFGDSFHYVKTQSAALVIGAVAMFVVGFVKLDALKKYNYVIYIVSVILLALVFVPVLGVESYGAKRWLNLGFFTIQPSEYAKFGLVVCVAAFIAKHGVDTFLKSLHVLALGSIVLLLLLLEPNMSITICVAMVLVIMLVVGGIKPKHLLALGVPAVIGGIALVFSEPYRVRRLLAFINPWESPLDEGYQLIQSYYALGSGGLFGIGFGNSRQKYLFLPFSESDFILSVIGEEIGLVGVIFVMALFVVIVARGMIIAARATDRFSSYLAAGISAVIAVQSALNFAVVCGAIPPTGLPLPFVSAGGSSLVAYLLAVGVLQNISRQSTRGFLSAAIKGSVDYARPTLGASMRRKVQTQNDKTVVGQKADEFLAYGAKGIQNNNTESGQNNPVELNQYRPDVEG